MQNTFFQPRNYFTRSFFLNPRANPPASPNTGTELLYAVIQVGIGCYGVGSTREDAITAARSWLAAEPDIHALPDYKKTLGRGTLCVARCTERYAEKIRQKGGVGWVEYRVSEDGVFDLKQLEDFEVSADEIEQDIRRNEQDR